MELTDKELKQVENVPSGAKLIDGEGMEDYGTSEVMKDRLKMSAEGVITVAIAVTGNYVINDPVVEAHGFVFTENTATEEEIRMLAQKTVESYQYAQGNKADLAAFVKKSLKNYFYKKTKQSPLIVVSVLEI